LSNYNSFLDTVEIYYTKDSETLANKLVFTKYLVKKSKTLADEIVFSLFLYSVEDNILADKFNYIYITLIVFIKH
jgi:hypothetical protein